MPPTPLDRDDTSDYATVADVESSDAASDQSWVISPSRKKKTSELNESTPRGKNDTRRQPEVAMFSSSSSPPGSVSANRRHLQVKDSSEKPAENGMSRSRTTSRARAFASPTTPSKASGATVSTPSSRITALENAFKKFAIDGNSPTPSTTRSTQNTPQQVKVERRVIVIDDSDEEEVQTDVEVLAPPTRPLSFGTKAPSIAADSSQSSMDSIFSQRSMASSASSLEFSSSESGFKSPSRNSRPVVMEDVFHSSQSHSPNVTTRKTQRMDTKAQIPTLSEPFLSEAQTPETISKFARSSFGVELEEVIIAHCDETQKLMDTYMIEWGTQYELARGVSTGSWSWANVRSKIQQLEGKNADAAFKVQRLLRGRGIGSIQTSDLYLWKELDREQAAIKENLSRGLGLMGEWEGIPEWYGGQIQQLARLVKEDGAYKIVLDPMEKRRSHRFARFYGSRRFLQLRIPEEILRKENAQVKRFLTKKFILCGRIFVPFHSKEHGLYMVETNDNCGRSSQDWCGDQFRLSLKQFINWHNPLEQAKNYNQVISKYATRFALGLSNSVPALEFNQENIIFIDDITASDWPKDKKNPPANKLMTDGCGFLNHAALYQIVKHLGYENLPAGVQGRIDGSKGFWILHPSDTSPTPKIWIRTSQNKIKNHTFDRAHRIFDLLGPSRPSPPIALTQQSIINVFANGIPPETLVRLMEEGLEEEVSPLLDWNKPFAMVFLWNAINKCGNVSGSRTQRLGIALNRALGLKGRDWGREDVPDDIDQVDEDSPSATYTGRNKYSGAPLALNEQAMELIQAGFHPSQNKHLYEKIGYIVKNLIKTSVEKYRIPIQESLGAYVVPDPLGVLEEGQIYYRFSRPRKDPKTEMLVHVLEGEVILGRYPIRLPSDMQRVVAVDMRELDKWPDVIIISTKGKRSIASLLADGDMDGDELIATWDKEFVRSFKSKPFTDAPADLISSNFEPSGKVETVEKFCTRTNAMSQQQASEAFLEHLIANLNESQVGLYSMMHENSTIAHGYDHLHSVRLAYIFATLLDSSKTGHRLKPAVLDQDLKKFGGKPSRQVNDSPSSRDILGLLKLAALKKGEELLVRYQAKDRPSGEKDKDLLQPYHRANEYALEVYQNHKIKAFTDELSKMRKHVDVAWELFIEAIKGNEAKKTQESPSKLGRKKVKSDQDDLMLACAHAYAQPLSEPTLTHDLDQVKASYAYTLSRNSESFGFSVAFQELCHIKALAASGGHAPALRIFDEAKSFSSSFLRALSRCDEETRG